MVGPTPSVGVCARCEAYSGPLRGLGDVVEAVTVATGVKSVVKAVVGDCGGCAKRRAALNAAAPIDPK